MKRKRYNINPETNTLLNEAAIAKN